MENKLKPPSCQFPSVSDFPIPSPMPNSPQHNKKGNQCYLHNHIGARRQSHKIPVALPIKLGYSLQRSQQFSQPPLPPRQSGERGGGGGLSYTSEWSQVFLHCLLYLRNRKCNTITDIQCDLLFILDALLKVCYNLPQLRGIWMQKSNIPSTFPWDFSNSGAKRGQNQTPQFPFLKGSVPSWAPVTVGPAYQASNRLLGLLPYLFAASPFIHLRVLP